MAKKQSIILDGVAKLEVGDSFFFYEDDWDLKTPLRRSLQNRFLSNRHFKIEYRIDGLVRITRIERLIRLFKIDR